MAATPRRRDEHGLVLPTGLMVFSICAVALAGLAFVAGLGTGGGSHTVRPTAATHSKPTPSHGTATEQTPGATPTRKKVAAPQAPRVNRAKVYVVVFNNSNVKGLAGSTGTRAQRAGWNVVGTDNWYGTVDTSTVYYPPRLKAAAALLGKDLGITRVKPSIAPMRPDRLTVILTGDYH